MSVLANGVAAAAEMFNIVDPPHDYQIEVPDPKPAPAAQPVGSSPAPTQPPAPSAPATAQPVLSIPQVATVATPALSPSPAPVAPRHPQWLVTAAESQGIHPLVLERLDTNDLNAIVISTMQRQLAERNNAVAVQTITAPQTQPVPVGTIPGQPATIQPVSAQAPVAPSQPQVPSFDWGVHPDVDMVTGQPTAPRQYTDADINPAIAAHIKTLTTEVVGLKKFIATMNNTVAQSTEEKIQREFDTEFQKYPGVFGQGDGRAVHGKPEFERRRIVYQSVKAMFQTLPPEARAAVTIGGAVQNYTKTLFGADPVATVSGPQFAPQPTPAPGQNFMGGAVAVPTQRKPAATQPGRDAAIEATMEWWNANKAANPAEGAGGTSLNEFL